ncbi:hypothetical protein [Vibrio navarrensis]|uniref:DUF1566 domain-containing protein n=1 Tax=Vibrio navarrensis TaxID=29495 RepID=A0AAJ4I9Y8_9VIBR|nr:DUF1566 domain-containing protein [Vibrio navarrensis]
MKRTQFKMKKKHAMKVAPLMMSLLLMACGGEDSGLPSQSGVTDPCAPTSYTCDSDGDGYTNGEETDNGTNPDDPNDPVENGDKDDDGDGYTNGEEVKNGTDKDDPNDPVQGGNLDDDGDGLTNGEEVKNGTDKDDPNDPVQGGDKDDDKDGIPNGKETVEGWDDNDANNPVPGGDKDDDGDGIKNGKETVEGWDDNDPNDPVQGGNLDSDHDGLKDGLETVSGSDKNDPNDPVQDGDKDKDGDGIKNGLETVEGWDDNDANNPVQGGNEDKDGDGIKNGRETVEGWDDNNVNNPVENGNLDSDGDGLKDGREHAEGWDKDNPNSPVENGDEDKDGDGFKNGLETIEGWDDNDASNPIAPEKVQNPDLVLDNSAVVPGTTLQAVIEFGLEDSTQTYSTLNVADADHVTWSVLDGSQNQVTELELTSEGLVTIPAMEEIISLVNQPLTMRATFVDGGWFSGQAAQDETFEVKLALVDGEASEIVTTVDGEPSHESTLEVSKGSDVKVEAEFHFEDGSHYTTSSSEFVTWTVSPEDSGVTVDENGMVDTSGVTESVVVTITATGHGPFDGVTKTTTMTVNLPDIATVSGAACGGQLNDADKVNARGACLKIATNNAGQWFTSTPSIAMMDALGYTKAAGNVDTNGGRTYAGSFTENGVHGPEDGVYAQFDQLAIGNGEWVDGQLDRWCHDLAALNFGGKSDWRRPTRDEVKSLVSERGDMYDGYGWPVGRLYWSTTISDVSGSFVKVWVLGFYNVNADNQYLSTHNGYAACVAG